MGEVTPASPPPEPPFSTPAPLDPAHDTSRFDCGRPPLNDWLRERAIKSEGLSARTYVVCAPGRIVAGYHTLATGAVVHTATSAKFTRNMPDPIPVMILARLAIDRQFQGRGLGSALLKDALSRMIAASKIVGARAVLVHAIDEEAVSFYAAFGFKSFPGDARTLFLPIESIAASL